MNILIIKLTSLGDVIHTLAALSCLSNTDTLQIDWLVAPEYQSLLALHPAIHRSIACPLRHWRGRYRQALKSGEMRQFLKNLREDRYDMIIDAQSAIKTAVLSRLCRLNPGGRIMGYDKKNVREYGAHWAYHQHFSIDKHQHAINRLIQLLTSALGHQTLDFNKTQIPKLNLDFSRLPNLTISLPKHFVLAIPNTTWLSKHWPDAHWLALFDKITVPILIPAGNAQEQTRAAEFARQTKHVICLPKMSLPELIQIIRHASLVISVDTGLGHLAAGLGIPAIHLYGPTNPNKIGAQGEHQTLLKSNVTCQKTCKRRCDITEYAAHSSACMAELSVNQVVTCAKSQEFKDIYLF
jgi:heptosyltransferase-1